jgi:ferredoxin
MSVTVDKKCIGCGLCVSIAPNVFEMKNGLSTPKDSSVDKKFPKETKEAAESCPVQAITIK